jgi:hypothetical protein
MIIYDTKFAFTSTIVSKKKVSKKKNTRNNNLRYGLMQFTNVIFNTYDGLISSDPPRSLPAYFFV